MHEIESNKKAWALIARDHHEHFRQRLKEEHSLLNRIITGELGDITGLDLIHLQCNTGADTVSLARLGATVTGVDLVGENVHYARELARDNGIDDAVFIEADILELMDIHHDTYDVVFVSEGAIGWLPDLDRWGRTIRHLLKDDGFLYVFDSHPFQLAFCEEKMKDNVLDIRYPYFGKRPDRDTHIGGYASEAKEGENYFWMYTVGDIINSLTRAGLCIEFFNEYDVLYCELDGMEKVEKGLYRFPHFRGGLPFTFSLKATVRR